MMPHLRFERLEDRTTPSSLPAGFTESTFISGLTSPTALDVAPDGRLFVAQQGGMLRVVQSGQLGTALTLSVDATGERGLLGVTLDPNFTGNGFLYLYYTQPTGGHRVSRFTVSGNTANPASEVVLLTIDDSPNTTNHNGGALHFGTDGKLYIAVGDDANSANAQTLANLHGKILRINADGSIPSDNPFFNAATGSNRAIWALGLRNPFTFDINASGAMFINDVGQSSFEEVNRGTAGGNYGWPGTEGDFTQGSFPNFIRPAFNYPHTSGTAGGFAITGGSFYPASGGSFPGAYAGDYFFADLTNNWIRSLDPATNAATLFASNLPGGTVDLDVANDGSLLVLSFNTGVVTRIAAPVGPVITKPPLSTTITKNQGTTFYALAEGSGTLSYQWQLNGVDIPNATRPTYTVPGATAGSGSVYRVKISNTAGTATSDPATLTVSSVNAPQPGSVLVGESETAIGPDGPLNLARLLDGNGKLLYQVAPYESGFTGGVRVATGDVNGDSAADLVVASGPGRVGNVRIYHGTTQAVLFDFNPFGDAFNRGVNVSAGDLTGDGKSELVISAEEGGGARVRIFTPTANGFVQLSDFFALIGGDGVADTTFRGGVRTAVGDITGDGKADLAVAAGTGGGPRVALFNGATLTATGAVKIRGDFFAFEASLRNGATVALGDFDGDGKADLAAGAGPGGGPRVSIFPANALLAGDIVRAGDFFADNSASRDGIRIAVKNSGGLTANLAAAGDDSTTRVFNGFAAISGGSDPTAVAFTGIPGYAGPIFVG